jgi:hypothetical protein
MIEHKKAAGEAQKPRKTATPQRPPRRLAAL